MATIAPSWVITQPSFMEPELILPYSQATGAFNLLAGKGPRVKLRPEDKAIYMRRIEVSTKVVSGQSSGNQFPSCSTSMSMISTPTYLNVCRAEYNHHDTAMSALWGVSVTEAQRLAMRQGHYQLNRNLLLYGNQPANGEGVVNANGATSVSLPADSFGTTNSRNYDPGQFSQFFLTQFQQTKQRAYQMGTPHRFAVLGPQRILGAFEYQDIVQLTSFQRPGGGSTSAAGLIKEVAEGWNGDTVDWCYDDTLIGQGAGGADLVIITMPELEKPANAIWNTNEFADLEPGVRGNVFMYADMAAPVEIPTPLAGGAIDVQSEMRVSPGWVIRPESTTLMSIIY